MVVDLTGKVIQTYRGAQLFGVNGADQFLEVSGKKTVNVRNISDRASAQTITLPFSLEMRSPRDPHTKFTDDRSAFASAPLKRAAFVDAKGQAIYVFALQSGPSRKQPSADASPAKGAVAAGSRWSKKLDYPAGTRVVVEDAPAGVRYDKTTRSLVWTVPKGTASGTKQILVSVIQPGKEEEYLRVSVAVR
jgi:hypothetical protein